MGRRQMTRRAGSSPRACTHNQRTTSWAWPTTLQEAKPKAGTVAGASVRSHRQLDDTDRPRERSPEAGPYNSSRSTAFQICPLFPQAAAPPDENQSGHGRRTVNRHVGPDRQRCRLFDEPPSRMPCMSCERCVHPPIGSKPAKGTTPGAPSGGKRGRNLPARPGRGVRGYRRVRNVACEKRPRRMTRPRTSSARAGAAGVDGQPRAFAHRERARNGCRRRTGVSRHATKAKIPSRATVFDTAV
jgi:hypothetical protein